MTIIGTAGNDTLYGTAGNDTIQGLAGDDALRDYLGGNDTYLYNIGDGHDTISDYNPAGTAESDVLKFGAGISASNLVFSDVNDGDLQISFNNSTADSVNIQYHLYGDTHWDFSTIQFNDGSTLDISLASTAYTLHTTGTAASDTLYIQHNGPNVINGGAGDDTIYAGSGNDTIDGGTGKDVMYGGAGNDTYYIDSLDDVVADSAGDDTVIVAAGLDNAKIPTSIEHVVYQSTDTLKLAYFVDALTSGTNRGPTGQAENVTYSFVTTSTLAGFVPYTDAEKADVRAALADYSSVSGLVFTEVTDATAGVGIRFFQDGGPAAEGASGYTTYPPNSEVHFNPDYVTNYHVLMHEIGHALGLKHPGDYNVGGGGADGPYLPAAEDNTDNTHMSYNGFGEGGDYMRTFDVAAVQYLYGVNTTVRSGNDTYTQNDRFIWDGGGTDTLNVSTATAGATLDLRAGAQQWIGAKSDSILADGQFFIDSGTSIENAIGSNFNDTIRGNELANTLDGGAGNDTLDGSTGNDTLIGGTGNDTFMVSAGDTITELADGGTDTVLSSSSYTLGANLENLTLQGTGNINAIGNSANNVLTGNSGNNVLNGTSGADTLIGGGGNDTYYVSGNDVVIENANAGTDTALVFSNYTLAANVENLIIQGTADFNGTGNALNNTLTGNSGNNILNGGSGADTLIGGAGNDTYYASSNDVLVEGVNAGIDTALAFSNYTLADNVENMIIQGTADFNGTGNALNNTLTGNSGNNHLNGGSGADTLIGGLGDDIYSVSSDDVIVENANGGTDTAWSYASYTLSANVENLQIQGTASFSGTGNELDNSLIGNNGNNALNGGAGNDSLSGGLGNDTLTGGAGSDHFIFNSALNAASNKDTITDFGAGDTLDLSHLIFSQLGPVGALNINDLVSGAGLSTGQNANDHLVYNTTNGGLYYDADASGAGGSILFAVLGTTIHPSLTATMIQVV